ncbi:MAG: MurR/RpiR family transcriptional regulator [Erysipelotrichaceae bacterium]|jgi:RpiR family carbohydrate utilization transcriptional regulator|nr:MurR/RpiR family transcriptional regulator [Erysipelotrichaceae bacterium]
MKKEPIKIKIKTNKRNLTKKESIIADFILSNPKEVSKMTINEVASRLGFADSTIFQFTRKLGYKSFRDFRSDLLFEEYDPEISVHENIKPTDTCIEMTKKVFESSIKSLNDTICLLTDNALKKASDILLNSDLITFFGVGGSNVVSLDAYHKFLRSPLKVQYATDYHIQLMQASLLTEKDCAVIITHTGLTKETIEIAKTVKKNKARIITITSYPSNELKKVSDVIFTSVSEETGYRSESLSSRISQLAIIDSLFIITMFNDENKANKTLYKIRNIINTTKNDA